MALGDALSSAARLLSLHDTLQIEVEKVDTAKFDDVYFKAAESKKKGSKKTEDGFFNEVRAGRVIYVISSAQ
jgi:hypothetical protein